MWARQLPYVAHDEMVEDKMKRRKDRDSGSWNVDEKKWRRLKAKLRKE